MNPIITEEKIINEILTRGVKEVIESDKLKDDLLSGRELRVKAGIDPTSPNIHIGRAVSIMKLRDFQQLGHQVVLIVGDFTGVIGDTSDKESERPMLSKETVKENMKNYLEQAGKILDLQRVEVRYNSEWLSGLGYEDIGNQANQFSLADFIARDNIKKRLDSGKRVSLREVLYPLMQGYDSVEVRADVEIGGNDQRFNLLAGRTLQQAYKQKPQNFIMTELILGTDGRKMSSSWGNTINLNDDARTMFGKIMSIPDELIINYFINCTRVNMNEIEQIEIKLKEEKLNPRDAKLDLAFAITELYYNKEEANTEKDFFIKTFSQREIPTDLKEIKVGEDKQTVLEILRKTDPEIAKSNSEFRRLLEQKAVSLNGQIVTQEKDMVDIPTDGLVLKIGKLIWFKIVK